MTVYLAKGVLATTAIEGNTLTEREVRQVLEGRLRLPPSREYLQREVQNVIEAYNDALEEIRSDPAAPLTVEWLCRFNERILRDLEVEDGVVPGELRKRSVAVGPYLAPPTEDSQFLLQRLCDWLNGPDFDTPESQRELSAPIAIVKAIAAHLYLAWIHPFGDGNGRTARLLELKILLTAGFPTPTCQLLSNHYSATRSEYYRRLDEASRSDNELAFLEYAVAGLVDQLGEQLETIWRDQFTDRWEQFIYQTFGGRTGETAHRQIRLTLAISRRFAETLEPVARDQVDRLTPELAAAYATKTQKTITRDLNEIVRLGLMGQVGRRYEPVFSQIQGLAPEVLGEVLEK